MFTLGDLQLKVRELAIGTPDFVYHERAGQACPEYVHPDYKNGAIEDGCLLGQALVELGVPTSWLLDTQYKTSQFGNPLPVNTAPIADLLPVLAEAEFMEYPTMSADREIKWLEHVQHKQDVSLPWMEAVEAADFKTGNMT